MQHQPLPHAWVEEIFTRLVVRYGADWTRKWEGIDMGAVRTDWASVLGGFREHPECIAYALDYLPEKPPTVQQFVGLCNRAPDKPEPPALEGPRANPTRVAAILAKLAAPSQKSPVDWAQRLSERESRGEKLSTPQRDAWRFALADQSVQEEVGFNMTPIPDDALPPAMLAEKLANASKRAQLALLAADPPRRKGRTRRAAAQT